MIKRGLDSFQIKIIALIFMIVDHLYSYIYYGDWPEWVGITTRFVAPVFLYLMIEGFYHTKSRKKYAKRLYIGAVVIFLGNILINYYFIISGVLNEKLSFYALLQGHNIFLTLAILFSMIWSMDKFVEKKKIICAIYTIFYVVYPLHLWILMVISYKFIS